MWFYLPELAMKAWKVKHLSTYFSFFLILRGRRILTSLLIDFELIIKEGNLYRTKHVSY